MIEKLKIAYETFHPRSFTVSLRKQYPEVYKWVLDQEIPVCVSTFADKVFILLNPEQPKCQNTDCNNLISKLNRAGWESYCSPKCKGRHNSLKSREKAKKTSMDKWGFENPSLHSDVRAKMKATMVQRYGVEFAKKSPLLQDKTKSTMVEKYGVEYAIQHPEFKEKIKQTCLSKYGVDNPSQKDISAESRGKLNDPEWLISNNKKYPMVALAEILGISIPTLAKAFGKFNIEPATHNKSSAEIEISNFLQSRLGCDYNLQLGTKKIIYPFELDIVLVKHNIAIEYNGGWYHSELNGKGRDYHIGKTELCAKKGIRLIHIWEHDYREKRDIILSKLNHICGRSKSIFARKCKLREISLSEANTFLDATHIQGSCISKHRLGLFYNEELVAVMTFGKTRFNKNYDWELLRYSSKLNCNVVGGFSKILKYFIEHYLPKSIITYSDKGWSVGDVYKNNNFKFLHTIPPAYFYTNDYKNFYNRISFQKKKLKSKLPEFDLTKTEWENMQANGYDRIWNCGNDAWVWTDSHVDSTF